jgi:hypothetical protein
MAFSSEDLPTPLWPGEDRLAVAQMVAQPADAEARPRAGQERGNAQLAVQADQRLVRHRVYQVDLVETDDRRDSALGRARQVAVDEVRLEVRLDQRHDDDKLVHVGHEDVLSAARRPRQQAVTRLDPLDEPLVPGRRPKPDTVAGGDDVALIGGQGPQQSPDGTAVLPAVVGLHNTGQPVNAEHPAEETIGRLDGGHDRGRVARAGRLGLVFLDDGPPPRQLPLGADALLAQGRLLLKTVLLKAARPVPRTRRLRAVLAEIDTYLFFLRHA